MKIRLVHIVLIWLAISLVGGFLKINHQLDNISSMLLAMSLLLTIAVVYKLVKRMFA